jgi:hypothetical protein
MQSSFGSATAKTQMRWVVWPAGRGRSAIAAPSQQVSPQAAQKDSKGALTNVPGFFESILQSTPLKEWSARSLRTFTLDAHAEIDNLELSKQLRKEASLASMIGIAGIAKARTDVHLSVDEEGALRMERSGAKILARIDANPAAAAHAAAARGDKNESKHPQSQGEAPVQIDVQIDVQADVAHDFSSGSLGGKAVLDFPRSVSFGTSSGSSSMQGRIEIPVKVVGERNKGVLESLVFESTLLARNVDLTHSGNGKELRITQLRGEFPVREQVAILPVSGHDGLVPFRLIGSVLANAKSHHQKIGLRVALPWANCSRASGASKPDPRRPD